MATSNFHPPRYDVESSSGIEFSFNPKVAKAIQEAERFQTASETLQLLFCAAGITLIIRETVSWFSFCGWLQAHNWTEYRSLLVSVDVIAVVFMGFLCLYPLFWVSSLLKKDGKRGIDPFFLVLSAALLLPPIFLRDTAAVTTVESAACICLTCRWSALWFANQRPRDWKIILNERTRLRWGAEDFAMALTRGQASDGSPLATITTEGNPYFSKRLGGEAKAPFPDSGNLAYSLLELRLKETIRFMPKIVWRDGICSEEDAESLTYEEHEKLSKTYVYVHPEICDRMRVIVRDRYSIQS